MSEHTSYDAIVISSGIGGLTVASLLTQLAGKRVLVFERHFTLGGFTHTFRRQGYRWDVGVHYVDQMQPGSRFRALFDLVTGAQVRWQPLPPAFDTFLYPDLRFAEPSDRAQYARDMMAAFPTKAAAIRRYFDHVARPMAWMNRMGVARLLPRCIGSLLS